MLADIEELEQMDTSEIHARRLNAKEVLTPMKGDSFIFPVADGTVKTPGGDRRLKPSTLIRDRPERGEDTKFFEENQTDFLLHIHNKRTPHGDDAEAKMNFGLSQANLFNRHHVEPLSQTVHAERRIISHSVEVHRRYQNNTYVT